MLLVDTNVLLDVVTGDPRWADWSQRQLEVGSLQGRLLVNPVIYAELSIGFERIEELEAILERTGCRSGRDVHHALDGIRRRRAGELPALCERAA